MIGKPNEKQYIEHTNELKASYLHFHNKKLYKTHSCRGKNEQIGERKEKKKMLTLYLIKLQALIRLQKTQQLICQTGREGEWLREGDARGIVIVLAF